MSVRYTSNTTGYNGMLPQYYTIANKVSMQVAEAQPTIPDESSLEGCTTQCSLFQLC